MKKILGLILLLTLVSCTQKTPVEIVNGVEFYRDALMKSRNVYNYEANVDRNNDLKIDFQTNFADQLVELNFEVLPMNTSQMKLVNYDPSAEKVRNKMVAGDLAVYLGGNNITSCLIDHCNSVSCTENQSTITSFSNGFSSNRIFLNLTKLKSCPGIDFDAFGSYELSFKENAVGKGSLVKAQVIVYNRTYEVKTISNLFSNW